MSTDAWFTLAVVVITIGVLATERTSPAFVLLGAVVTLLLFGVIDEQQALSGFSNPAPITIAALYVLAGAVGHTGALERLTRRALPNATRSERSSTRRELARIVAPAAGASAFLNNTPLVAMLAPRILTWARRTGRSPSTYLLPLSYAAILGGVITLIGTSTNLAVSGLLEASGQEPLGFFELARVGVPVAVVGCALLVLVAPWFLPHRRAPSEDLGTEAREYTVEMLVPQRSVLAGRSVIEVGLRNLEGVFLVEIERGDRSIAPVSPDEILAEGDRLVFVGNVARILDLQRIEGLVSAEEHHSESIETRAGPSFFEVVLADASSLVGSTLKEVSFRGRYGAAVVAVHRAGERMPGKLGRVELHSGDVLLVVADSDFASRWRDRGDFLVIASLEGEIPLRRRKARIVELVTVGLVIAVTAGFLSMLEASLLAAGAVVVLGAVSVGEARRSIDLGVVVLVAAAFGLGAAVSESGLADQLAELIVSGTEAFGDVGVLAGVLIATILLTELLSNNAAAVLMFPIALATAAESGLDPRPLVIAIAIGASCSFLTPIGYQTNTMVHGIGGYRYTDFTRLGAPLTLATIVVALVFIPIGWSL